MVRKVTLLLLTCLLVGFVTGPAAAAKSYFAEYFDVQIELQPDGSAIITETVKFHFEGDPFTFAFREVSANQTDGITFLEAGMDGAPMPQGTQPGQIEVEPGDPLKITWHFVPASNEAHVFTLGYRAHGVIRKGDADTILWRAIPEDHEYSIERSTITLIYPSGGELLGEPTLDRNFEILRDDARLILTTGGIGEDEEVILTARFAPDSLTQTIPQWQVRRERAQAAAARGWPVGLGAGLLTLILGGLGLLTYSRAHARDLNFGTIIPAASPPSDLSPALAAKLTGQHGGMMGTIFDLAQRGVLEVHEERSSWGVQRFVLIQKSHTETLSPYERTLLSVLFGPGETRVEMSEVGTRLASKARILEEPLERELIQRGWLDPERKQSRTRLLGLGVLSMIFAALLFTGGMIAWGASLERSTDFVVPIAIVIGFSAGLFLFSIVLLIYAGTYSVLTPVGEEMASRWRGFAEYLKQVSRGREPAIRPDYFERYLSYAAVFGLGTGWAKYFQRLGGVPLPVWFHSVAGDHRSFGAFVAASSHSTGASGAAGAAGAASGGGASGAG
jgi:uncharacterized protein (TIGR04222 family)